MKRLILPVLLALLTSSLAFAQQRSGLTKFAGVAKSIEGGIAVNPVTHKAYFIAEEATEGSDDSKAVFVLDMNAIDQPAKVIPIANENEYITIDAENNLIYLATKFDLAEEESDSDTESVCDVGESCNNTDDPPDPPQPPVTNGTFTVIDGETDTVAATWNFPDGIEPEGVAIDPKTGLIYVGAKEREGESDAADDVCNPWAVPIYDVGEPADVECWTGGYIYVFSYNRDSKKISFLKTIPAGDDPESVVFMNGKVYAANEDDGTVTIASAVTIQGGSEEAGYIVGGGDLLTATPVPPTPANVDSGAFPYSLAVFYPFGPNPMGCLENQFEADKMAAGANSVFITDDRSRVAKIKGIDVQTMRDVPGATECQYIPNSDGGGLNTANNIAFMDRADGRQLLYVVSEQNTVAVYDPGKMVQTGTITIPEARHLDGIAVDGVLNRVWLTDEDLQLIFVLEGACADGREPCSSTTPQANTTNFLSVGPNPAGEGQAISFAATVSTDGSRTPIGNVAFYDHGISLGSGSLDASGIAAYSNNQLLAGTHTITAVYGGDTYNSGSASPEVSLTINPSATMISPTNGSTVGSGVPVTFTWTAGTGATTTYLWVGTTIGGNDLVNFGGGSATSFTANNLPVGTIYVRLWSLIDGELQSKDYTYNVVAPQLAAMVSPANGSSLPTGVPVTFTWTPGGTGVTTTYLWVSTVLGGNELVNFGGGSATSFIANNLPAGTIYVRLWSKIGEQLQYRDYTYTVEVPVLAAMISPANGSTVGNPVTFTWSSGGGYVTTTYLWVGTAPGGNNFVNFGGGSATSFAADLPAGPVYVRLWSLIGGQLQYQEYAYTVQ